MIGLLRYIWALRIRGFSVRSAHFGAVAAALIVSVALGKVSIGAADSKDSSPDAGSKAAQASESSLIDGIRQLTFDGRRAGEGYFSQDGTQLIFQSEREPGNPFFQIYLMDLDTGDVRRISPGHGKTTCSWIHPDGVQVLFASTHEDKDARKKQADEIQLRSEGKERRYSWDYDDSFEIYSYDTRSAKYTNLTSTKGYDAEGSWSPDGKLLAFASNRRAYDGSLGDEEKKKFELDPAYAMDIFLMNADGSDVLQLTSVPGYDGGPFFSPDGKRLCWRRFSENGATAEIMTMNIDGSDQRQLTRLGSMSWAPYYHPTGRYLIFTTNMHGFANFELYLIDTEAKAAPVRVTYTDGFDGLPVFTPDGRQIAWTSNRTPSKQSQIFVADWNHEHALELLGIETDGPVAVVDGGRNDDARRAAKASARRAASDFSPVDIMRHVDYLCRPELGGRLTGTEGERLATAYVAAYMENLGLAPAGDDGTWFQQFEFTSGVDLDDGNTLAMNDVRFEVEKDWRPVAFSSTGNYGEASVVFAGYGITAPETDDQEEYDSFIHLDVQDKWVMVLRYLPEEISPERRQHLSTHASLRYKTMVVRDKGARGLIVVSGPNAKVKDPLVKLRSDGTLSGSSLPVVSVTDEVAQCWLATSGKDLKALQDKLDTGELMMGFELKDANLSASIDIRQVKRVGRNVLGRLLAGDASSSQMIVVGAHVDHLGAGPSSSSLARDDEKSGIHLGADDNASGIAAMLEIAEYLTDQKRRGRLSLTRDIVFAAWSGEELGLIGSSHFAKTFGDSPHRASAQDSQSDSLYPKIAACLNLDMVGRLDQKLILQGVGSSSIWRSEIERRNAPVGLPITLQNDSYLPTDASVFFMRGVPILSAFTGSHSQYHTPRDTPDTLNYEGAAQVARLMGLLGRSLAIRDDAPDYVAQAGPEQGQRRANLRAYLGTIPDYADEVRGVKLSGVSKDGPAAKAGVRSGDVIVELAGRKIENIYDYTYAIEALKIGQPVRIVVERSGKLIEQQVVPGSRE